MLPIFLITACALLLYCMWRRLPYYNKNEPPYLPQGKPFIGHLQLLSTNGIVMYRNIRHIAMGCHELGGVCYFTATPFIKLYFVTDPDDCVTVIQNCVEKSTFYNYGRDYFGDCVLVAKYSLWQNKRKLLNPSFNSNILDGFINTFNIPARWLVKQLSVHSDKGPFDHNHYISLATLDIFLMTTFGINLTDEEFKSKLVENYDNIEAAVVRRIFNVLMHFNTLFKWSTLKEDQNEYLKTSHEMAKQVIQQKKKEINSKQNHPVHDNITNKESKIKPILERILDLYYKDGLYTEKELIEEVAFIMLAGFDTSAAALQTALVLIGSYPAVQEKIYEELKMILDTSQRNIEKHDLSQMVYLEATLKETLRFCPIIVAIARQVEKELPLKNYTLSPGCTCIVSLERMSQNEDIWGPDANEFRPERWLDPAKIPTHPAAFASFSIGRRNCIAKSFAITSIKVVLAHIFLNYKITADYTKTEMSFGVVSKPARGHHISIENRKEP